MKTLILLFILFVGTKSFAQTVRCPLEKDKLMLSGLSVFNGDPKKMVQLKPDNGDGPFPHKWSLSGVDTWIACNYGPASKPLYKSKIGAAVQSCETAKLSKLTKGVDSLICEPKIRK